MSELPDVSVAALRRLARGILFDRHGAEDVLQEAWLTELRASPPAASRAGWLRVVVRNLALNRRREEARRGRRERAVARPEAHGDPSEALAHIEVLRRLLAAVEQLDEPYRSAVVLRYLEEQPPRRIARRLGLPVNTVRTHVRRGLERLRRDLDGERGEGRQGSLAALVAFAGPEPWLATLVEPARSLLSPEGSGAILMQKKLVVALVAVLVVGLTFLVSRSAGVDARRAEDGTGLAAVAPSAAAGADEPVHERAREVPAAQRESATAPEPIAGAWVVRGHAFRAPGQAFPGLALVGRVYAGTQRAGTPVLEARFAADAAGDFEWALEPPTDLVTVEVRPAPTDLVAFPAYEHFLPGDPAPQTWTVRAMPLDCTVRGTVHDREGRPIAGALVRQRDRFDEQQATTDAEGRYALRIPASDDERLRFHAPGFAQRSITVDAQGGGEIRAPAVVLAPELVLRGRVVDEDGHPVEGARVEPGHPYFHVATESAADGSFELGTLDPEAEHLALEAHKAGHVSAVQRIEREQRGAPIELRLARGVHVTGRVRGPDGAPVWGAWVSVGSYPWAEPRIEAYTDREGRFELAQVPTGSQTFWCWRRGLAQEKTFVSVPSGQREHVVELVLSSGHFVGGVVLDERDQPLSWVMVYAEDPPGPEERIEGYQVYTGPDGRFRIEDLPALPILLGTVSSGRTRVELPVQELDRDDYVLRVARAGAFAGTVVDAESGAPIPAFVVRMGFPGQEHAEQAVGGYPAAWGRGVSFSDPAGRWRLDGDFTPGRFAAFTIEAAGFAPASFDAVAAALDPEPSDFVARLVAGTRVRGRVVEKASGAPVAGARVRRVTARVPYEALEHTDELVLEAHTDAGGRFELVDVPTGAMSLVVEHPAWSLASDGPFEVSAAAPRERWIELARGAGVHGRLLDGSGAPLGGETVAIYCLEGVERTRTRSTTTDAEGRYALAGLSAGPYHVRWERTLGGRTAYDLVQFLELAADETREQDLRPRGQARVTGLLEYDGELPEVEVVMVLPRPARGSPPRKWAEHARAVFAVDGAFTIEDLEPGPYNLSVHLSSDAGALAMGYVQVEVPEQGTLDTRIRIERRR